MAAENNSNLSRVSDISLNEFERESLTIMKVMMERELNSLSSILEKGKKNRSVPTVKVNRSVSNVQSFRTHLPNRQRGTESIFNESPFLGFSRVTSPYFRHVATGNANVWIQNSQHDLTRDADLVIPNEQMSNHLSTTRQPQHHEVNVISLTDQRNTINNSSSSYHPMGWSTTGSKLFVNIIETKGRILVLLSIMNPPNYIVNHLS